MTKTEADAKLAEKLAFVAEVEFDFIVLVINGVRFTVPVRWDDEE
jgi:hypothetical protein